MRTLTICVFALGCRQTALPPDASVMDDAGADREARADSDRDAVDFPIFEDRPEVSRDAESDALPPDAGVPDVMQPDAGVDAGVPDALPPDTSVPDSEPEESDASQADPDAAVPDAGVPDTLPPDAGVPDAIVAADADLLPDAGTDAEPDAGVIAPYCADPLGCWEPMSDTGAPYARREQVAVWTGSEMIIWAGVLDNVSRSDGGRYDPVTDSWRTMSVDGAPSPRYYFSTVWTGSEMIVWGGGNDVAQLGDGARYNPGNDTWTPVTMLNAPSARAQHTAVWTGSEMIVWGGLRPGDCCGLTDGSRYNPVSNTWIGFSGGGVAPIPSGRDGAVWTGAEMVALAWPNGAGAIFHPETEAWSAVSTSGAPSRRTVDSPIWTGSDMLIWAGGGAGVPALDGGRYNPLSNIWTAMSSVGAPTTPRGTHTAVWTGAEMIVWGGGDVTVIFDDGGRYDPTSDAWSAMSSASAPSARAEHSAVWATDCAPDSGDQPCLIVWGGWNGGSHLGDGGRYFLP